MSFWIRSQVAKQLLQCYHVVFGGIFQHVPSDTGEIVWVGQGVLELVKILLDLGWRGRHLEH